MTAIRTDLNSRASSTSAEILRHDTEFNGDSLEMFSPATEVEVREAISSLPSKSCSLDPVPTWLLKQSLEPLLPIITSIINQSLLHSKVPSYFKHSIVRPILKKPGLDKEVLKNYRPVSNLPFLAKTLEKIVATRLQRHLSTNALQDNFQSAYRRLHSTESALLRVHHDIVSALDCRSHVVMIMLDLSAAFDLIDHDILFKRLEHTFGLGSDCVKWFKSYLEDRVQCVQVGNNMSGGRHLGLGVPQGSVLGPLIYCMFTRPVGDIIRHHNINYHCYADDTQLYLSFDTPDWESVSARLQLCLSDVIAWMQSNFLKLNHDKTELIVFSPNSSKNGCNNNFSINIGPYSISSVSVVKNLGVLLDQHLTMESHINSVCKSCFWQVRNIGKIRKYLNDEACKTLVHALIISKLDYCNALLHGLPTKLTNKLQRVQNRAARLVTRTRPREHISPILQNLHWLPINHRLQYKILLHTFKSLNEQGPVYLSDLIHKYQPTRCLRSQAKSLLTQPIVKSCKYGNRQFDYSAAILWNSLPDDLKCLETTYQFKKHLKTLFFRAAYF